MAFCFEMKKKIFLFTETFSTIFQNLEKPKLKNIKMRKKKLFSKTLLSNYKIALYFFHWKIKYFEIFWKKLKQLITEFLYQRNWWMMKRESLLLRPVSGFSAIIALLLILWNYSHLKIPSKGGSVIIGFDLNSSNMSSCFLL